MGHWGILCPLSLGDTRVGPWGHDRGSLFPWRHQRHHSWSLGTSEWILGAQLCPLSPLGTPGDPWEHGGVTCPHRDIRADSWGHWGILCPLSLGDTRVGPWGSGSELLVPLETPQLVLGGLRVVSCHGLNENLPASVTGGGLRIPQGC